VEAAPPILIVRGDMAMATRNPVALVGARNASAGAVRIARDLATALAERGSAVVSGLARGVDAAAHEGALSVPDGAGTVAVIAGGSMWSIPRTCRPSGAHRRKRPYHQRNAPGTEPTNRHFPARNRIIAGLAMGTVVVEAALQSGSLITARLAGDYGREVMAVPGSPLDPRSHGCNQMIREGAILVQGVDDILELITSFQGLPRSHFREEAGGVPLRKKTSPRRPFPRMSRNPFPSGSRRCWAWHRWGWARSSARAGRIPRRCRRP
jgi:DNA processing protein